MSSGTSSGRAPSVDRLRGSVDDWLSGLGPAQEIGRLLARPAKEQQAQGYAHTLREIAQQPVTWLGTAAAVVSDRVRLDEVLERAGIHARTGSLVLTGSGSSLYAGECLALPLQAVLRVPAQALPAGQLLTHPESRAVLDSLLEADVRGRHLVITCNRAGALATASAGNPRVDAVVLDAKTEDQSLVMTSSFTNMVLAGSFLAATRRADVYARRAEAG